MILITVGVFLFFLCLESLTSFIVIRRSKKHYPALWDHSGQPTLMGNGDLISCWPLVNYYQRREYLECGDDEAIRFATKIRGRFIYSYYFAFITLIPFLGTIIYDFFLS